MKHPIFSVALSCSVLLAASCSGKDIPSKSGGATPANPVAVNYGPIDQWLTRNDKSALLSRSQLSFNDANPQASAIEVDSTVKYQQIDGFGFCLTDASAYLISQMSATGRANLLKELFATDGNNIGISYLRVSIGASDLSKNVYSYDDMPGGQTDPLLSNFSIDGTATATDLIPVLKDILAIDPSIKILGSPWSAPAWMKDNNATKGGSLMQKYYGSYAAYFVRYIQAMKAAGITIDAITPQNEPLNPDNNPSMHMTAEEESAFIRNSLGPMLRQANLDTKIWIYDHNCDHPEYATTILADPDVAQYVDGSAFHLYAGDISVLGAVHNAYPNKNVYFTEQYTASSGQFGGDLIWAIKNLIIGAPQNWSKNVLEWNLASDPDLSLHTNGGCNTCLGAITIDGNNVVRNQSYYIIAHASKFVRPGSYRIASTSVSNVSSVAFITPDGKKVLIAVNTSNTAQSFNIKFKKHTALAKLDAGAVATFVW